MEQLIAQYIPDYLNEIDVLVGMAGEYFVGGVLVAFTMWALGFACGEIFGVIKRDITGGG